jgi:hypothetical protein
VRAEWTGHYLDGRSAARQAATVRITPGGLEILLADTGTRVWWPYAGLRQTQGFYAGEPVRLERGGEALQVADVAFLVALRAQAPATRRRLLDPARRRSRSTSGVCPPWRAWRPRASRSRGRSGWGGR